MANAKKCDRCGAYYQEANPNLINTIAFAVEHIAMKPEELKCISVIEKLLDLCPPCTKSLKRWVKGDAEQGDK